MRTGILVTLEGIDGAGKTTQIQRLREWLQAQGLDVRLLREPGGTALGEEMRALLLRAVTDPPTPAAEWFLFLAARAQLCERVLRPALEAGAIVLCDRFTDSTLAYQGAGRGMEEALLRQANAVATSGIRPDLTLWLDLPVESARVRQEARCATDRMEQEAEAFRLRVAEGYRRICAAEPQRVKRVDASGDPEAVFQSIKQLLQPLLEKAGKAESTQGGSL